MKADVLVIFSSYEFPFKMRIVVTHFIPILIKHIYSRREIHLSSFPGLNLPPCSALCSCRS